MSISFKKLMGKKHILIIGDAGVGKTTVANELGEKLDLPVYSTDDVLWLKKFTEHRDKEEAVGMMKEIYKQHEWIVEGTTRDLLKPGVELAEVVLFLSFSTIFGQYKMLIERYLRYRKETLWNLVGLMIHVTRKRFSSCVPVLLKMVEGHPNVVVDYYPVTIDL